VVLPRDATDKHLEEVGGRLEIVFDVDLGQLVKGHHVIARGIDLGHEVSITRWQQERNQRLDAGVEWPPEAEGQSGIVRSQITLTARDREVVETVLSEPELHYEFVPGLEEAEEADDHFYWYWVLEVSDDVGTDYQDHNNGCLGRSEGGPATHGTRDLGGRIPESATRLTLSFTPPWSWTPIEPIRQKLLIDLATKRVVD
jgi:hypothetical protein